MTREYSVEIVQSLSVNFQRQNLLRPLHLQRHEPGTRLEYDVLGMAPARPAHVALEVERFIGGGFAGQVYRVKLLEINAPDGPLDGLEPGNVYALKLLVPSFGFARAFRNLMYGLAFQAPFALQSNPDAARAGALWQKLIRRAAGFRLGSEKTVVDIYATLIDLKLGTCGEISEWVDGRLWRFEVDDRLDTRLRWRPGDPGADLASPEYRAKKTFMADLVRLMHDMGAPELARQYEWWTMKSQPNALKRLASDADSKAGLVAVDFRAGLALLPFLPQSPADFKLILKGIGRGSLVQFDRGNIKRLKAFVAEHAGSFRGLEDAASELEARDAQYRASQPDIAHHHIRLLTSPKLWRGILRARVRSWRIRNYLDDRSEEKLQKSPVRVWLFSLLALLPFLGRFLLKLWGRRDYRRHIGRIFASPDYLRRAFRGRAAESLIRWHRAGRVSASRAESLSRHSFRFLAHLPLRVLPAGLHRFFSDRQFIRQVFRDVLVRPVRLYFRPEAREQWLRDMVSEGQGKGVLTPEEAHHITAQIRDPFIQKYLKSLAVHLATLFVSETVFLTIAVVYVLSHPELGWQQATLRAGLMLGAFQFIPISPGSIVRGLYVIYLVARERNIKDYAIALPLSFFKMLGYLAFPIQMAYRYPDLARFMAGHWATDSVHFVPVFGERGALLEHAAFDAFYNYPLTVRRRVRLRAEGRRGLRPRAWHVWTCLVAGLAIEAAFSTGWQAIFGRMPGASTLRWIMLWAPFLCGALVAAWSGGMRLRRRVLLGSLSGLGLGFLTTAVSYGHAVIQRAGLELGFFFKGDPVFPYEAGAWTMFIFALLGTLGAFWAETRPLRSSPRPDGPDGLR